MNKNINIVQKASELAEKKLNELLSEKEIYIYDNNGSHYSEKAQKIFDNIYDEIYDKFSNQLII